MTVWTLCNAYQERDNIDAMWDSVKTFIPHPVELVVVDGKYPDYEAESEVSTDGTREFAIVNGHLVTSLNYECEKRTAGLRFIDGLAEDGDFVLNMDADEELTSIFGWPERVGYISFTRESRPITYGRCRLYRWERGMEFKHRHYDLYDAWGNLISSLEDAPDFQPVGTGVHHDLAHDPQRRLVKRAYYKRLRERETHPSEQPIGAAHG